MWSGWAGLRLHSNPGTPGHTGAQQTGCGRTVDSVHEPPSPEDNSRSTSTIAEQMDETETKKQVSDGRQIFWGVKTPQLVSNQHLEKHQETPRIGKIILKYHTVVRWQQHLYPSIIVTGFNVRRQCGRKCYRAWRMGVFVLNRAKWEHERLNSSCSVFQHLYNMAGCIVKYERW